MTTVAPHTERATQHAARVVEAARQVLAAPDNLADRRRFMQRCFNIDWLAAAIVTLAESDKQNG